ncbi:MAG TPA: OmpA family protein [Candidatus Angelobacter sp.]|nr:OmpA family protein [Candidatus Angelobacter sp.]
MNVRSRLLVLLAGASLVFSVGCSTKNYVRKQTEPIIDKTNQLDDLTAKNNRDIRDVDARAQKGIQGVNEKTAEADQKALAAGQRADQAGQLAKQANTRIDTLTNQVANLDNYHPVLETSVHFAFNKALLTDKAKAALDQLVAEIPNTKGYLVVVEGDTDAIGSEGYNYKLSERRADAVVQYLATKNVPGYKIYIIGLGKDKSVASNKTSQGRAQNRRVDVRLMTNTQSQEAPASAQSTAPNPSM